MNGISQRIVISSDGCRGIDGWKATHRGEGLPNSLLVCSRYSVGLRLPHLGCRGRCCASPRLKLIESYPSRKAEQAGTTGAGGKCPDCNNGSLGAARCRIGVYLEEYGGGLVVAFGRNQYCQPCGCTLNHLRILGWASLYAFGFERSILAGACTLAVLIFRLLSWPHGSASKRAE